MLRAVKKGNAPTLIASLATDSSAAFASAAGTAGGVIAGTKAESKVVAYAEYQAAVMEALAQAFAGGFPRTAACMFAGMHGLCKMAMIAMRKSNASNNHRTMVYI